jgi:aspartyl-tRNA(Asn)/glutamyl-tRNA(Gln) amidotransferase subunit B
VNIHINVDGKTVATPIVEVKNLNSFRSLERAMEFEIARHAEALERGEPLVQETRGWDEDGGRTISQRSKEEANDYRYFPEPDLPPLRPSADWVARLRAGLPELPAARRARYERDMGLSEYDAGVLTADVQLADYFDRVVAEGVAPKSAANWVSGEFSRLVALAAGAAAPRSRASHRPVRQCAS